MQATKEINLTIPIANLLHKGPKEEEPFAVLSVTVHVQRRLPYFVNANLVPQ